MKKNALLTFLFACIPGAGQMYYGYMLRGLSLLTMFCGCLLLGAYISAPLAVVAGIVWMYSFFDTYDLIRRAAAGEPRTDALMLIGSQEELKRLIPNHNRLLGWVLVGLGAFGLYDQLLRRLLSALLEAIFGDYGVVYAILDSIPSIVVAVLFILAGLWLLGIHPPKKQAPGALPPYPRDPQDNDPADGAPHA